MAKDLEVPLEGGRLLLQIGGLEGEVVAMGRGHEATAIHGTAYPQLLPRTHNVIIVDWLALVDDGWSSKCDSPHQGQTHITIPCSYIRSYLTPTTTTTKEERELLLLPPPLLRRIERASSIPQLTLNLAQWDLSPSQIHHLLEIATLVGRSRPPITVIIIHGRGSD